MTAIKVDQPYTLFTETDGTPLENGYVYIGEEGLLPEDNPIEVYWDADFQIPAGQPIRTIGGYPSNNGRAGNLYAKELYSIKVLNKREELIFYKPIVFTEAILSDYTKTFDTVADMVADATLIVGQKVRTIGYYVVGDGGGNDYDMVAAGTGTDDGGSFIDLTGSPTLQAKGLFANGKYSVKQWGATGDGSTDDTVAIQSSIDFITANELLFFPYGSYKVTDTIKFNKGGTPYGVGGFGSRLLWYGEVGGTLAIVTGNQLYKLKGLNLDARGIANHALQISEDGNLVRNFSIDECVIQDGAASTIRIGDYTDSSVDGDIAQVNISDSIVYGGKYQIEVDSTNALGINLRGCFIARLAGTVNVERNIFMRRGGSIYAYGTYFSGQPTSGTEYSVHIVDGWFEGYGCEWEFGQAGGGGGVIYLGVPQVTGLTSRNEHVTKLDGCRVLSPGATSTGYLISINSALHSFTTKDTTYSGKTGLTTPTINNQVAANVISSGNSYTGRPFLPNPTQFNITSINDRFSDSWTINTRVDLTTYAVGNKIKWTVGSTVWECTTAGTSAGSAPSITGLGVGDTVVDGTATWTCRGLTNTLISSTLDRKVVAVSNNSTTYECSIQDDTIILTATACDVILPSALGNTEGYYGVAGKRITVYQTSTSTSNDVLPDGSDTIDGATTGIDMSQWSSVTLESDGFSNWKIIHYYDTANITVPRS